MSLFLLALICVGLCTAPFVVCSNLILINIIFQNMTPLSLFWVIFKHGVLFLGSFLIYFYLFLFLFFTVSLGTLNLHSMYFYNAQQFQNNSKNSNTQLKITVCIVCALVVMSVLCIYIIYYSGALYFRCM